MVRIQGEKVRPEAGGVREPGQPRGWVGEWENWEDRQVWGS